ncbi:hypothetical protein N7495_007062 [Penicillium taxi]|uniref:uncharacterized protein n=1 Tax=Penicillium taxi TaxID=168475 RepID=UPI0025455178|nr:uncharacterized protein N7495_007062 [Penicillium taxi]KAJ5895371.1 hypothetical protein N7495_007062 [Penicillium taxi]
MSIRGPCLWVPSLSSPVSSPISAVTSHFSAVARHGNGERVSPRTTSPSLTPHSFGDRTLLDSHSIPVVMNSAGLKAENASVSSMVPSNMTGLRPGVERENLPRVRLEIPPNTNYSTSRESGLVSPLDMDGDDHDDSADDKGDDDDRSPTSAERKKMKRFRLTHNQTRFLMSEFTRQAHPDAAHRQRLSREIPGLTPRQVQVWFQNRRAKLKRLTTNDRERMLKSRALPDDFDTTKVLRTPFESKSHSQPSIVSPLEYGASNSDFTSRTLRTDCYQRPNEEDYLGRGDGLSPPGLVFGRPSASVSLTDLNRTLRSDYSITRSSSVSDGSPHPSSYQAYSMPNRYILPYVRPGIDYTVPRSQPGMMPGYEQSQSFDGSVSPTDTRGVQITYDMRNIGSQPQSYPSLSVSAPKDYDMAMGSQLPPGSRPIPILHPLSTPTAQPFPYGSTSGLQYANNTSTLSLPSSFVPSEQSPAHNQMQAPQTIESLRTKFATPSFQYANYVQQ